MNESRFEEKHKLVIGYLTGDNTDFEAISKTQWKQLVDSFESDASLMPIGSHYSDWMTKKRMTYAWRLPY